MNIYEPEADLSESVASFSEARLSNVYAAAAVQYGLDSSQATIDASRETMTTWKDLPADVDRQDEDTLTALAIEEIYSDLDPATYGVR